jgi:dethiobiotin synthetase
MAPPMAASALGLAVPVIADLAGEIAGSWPSDPVDIGIVEGAGGVASPLAGDGDSAALARELTADAAILVADAGLGTINVVRLSCAALSPIPVVVHLNRFDPGADLHRRNRAWLVDHDGLNVTTGIAELTDRVRS